MHDMGTYYHLTNDTKKQQVHLAGHVKYGPLTLNEAVHYALVNYMVDNQGDVFRLLPDDGSEPDGYEDIDLLRYKFQRDGVTEEIVKKLNNIHGKERFKVVDGIGTDLLDDTE